MKFVSAVLVVLSLSSAVLAQSTTSKQLAKDHDNSQGVQQIKAKIEQEYKVICEGKTSSTFADFTKRVTYKAKCIGEERVSFQIVSDFLVSRVGTVFLVKKYTVEL
jgi:hypothetical protein